MDITTAIYAQFRKPTGLVGRVAGWIMTNRSSNIERNRWTVDLLNIQESDHVLEIGFGPGLSIAHAARLAPKGHIVGLDHSPLMLAAASRRNRSAIEKRLVDLKLGNFDELSRLGEEFDEIFSVNVLQFLPERTAALKAVRSVLKPNGVLATTYQPRHRGAKPEDAAVFASTLSKEMIEAGFENVSVKEIALKPMPAVCVLGRTSTHRISNTLYGSRLM